MKKVLLILSALLISLGTIKAQTDRCGTMENLARLEAQDPGLAGRMNSIEQQIQSRMANNKSWRTSGVITIPVVFHVLYSTNNATQNVSLARIQAQLTVLNQDYSATNTDITSVPSVFQSAVGTMGVQFCLAVRDPNGNVTDGIIRKQTATTSFSTNDNIKNDATGGDNAWPSSDYLNIWIGNLGGGLLGYAQFPGGAAATDGVVVLNGSVGGPGALGTTASYNRGRTATHEVGHWLNLRHIWGDSNCGNDFVADTPTQQAANFGCPNFPHVTCSNGPNGDMSMNYMDYVDDACMYMFTAGQGTRINTSITASRASLLNSLGCVPVVAGVPVANFVASSTSIPVGASINYTDLSTGSPTTWAWTFSGGTPSTSAVQNPTNITYNAAGTYTVTLTVSNANGNDTETKTSYITVTAGGTGCDTLSNFPTTATPSLYNSTTGYVTGHNDYGDISKADYFTQTIQPNYQITGALIGFGVATAANSTNTFDVTVWDDNGAGNSPSTQLGTTPVLYATAANDVSLGNLTYVSFTAPINVTGPFFLGFEFDYSTVGDTIAGICTLDGEVPVNTSWEQFSTLDWHAFSETPASWGLTVSMQIYPILCASNGVNSPEQDGYVIYPNPTQGQLIIHSINNSYESAVVNVFNSLGQNVISKNYADFSGTHYFDLSDLSNGLYFVEVTSGGKKMNSKILLNK